MEECVCKLKAAPFPRPMCTMFCCCWPRGVVGDAPASSKRSGKSAGLTSAAHAAARLVTQGLVRPGVVIEGDPLAGADARLETIGPRIQPSAGPRTGSGLQVDLFVLQAAPQPFDENVVQPAPTAIHADPHSGGFQLVGKPRAGELRTLVGVEDLRPPLPQRVFECIEAERGVHPRVMCGWPPARKDFFACLHRRPIAVMCSGRRRGASPQALMGSVDRGLIKPAGSRCPMTRDRCPSICRLTGPRA